MMEGVCDSRRRRGEESHAIHYFHDRRKPGFAFGLALAGVLLRRTGVQRRAGAIRLGDRKRPADYLTSIAVGATLVST